MSCGGRVYKGDSMAISIPFDVSGYTDLSVSYFTIGDTKIVRDESGLTVADGYITAEFSGHDLDLLPDGVVRYTIEYAVDNTDYVESSNTMLYLKTPASYSAKTEDEIFQSGYTTGYYACGGGDCSEVESIAYSSGITKGMADQRALLGSQTFTSNQTATNPNGWSSVTVNVPHNVRLGTLVQTPLPSQLNSVGQWIQEFTSGGSTDGWDKVQLGMGQMINYGKEQQKALLSSTAITDNGTYTREDGWSSVTVNVTCPDCPACDCTEAYDSGYTQGYQGGYQGGYSVGYQGGYGVGYQGGYTAGQADCPDCPACDCTEAYQSGLTAGAAEQKSKLGSITRTTNGTVTTTGDGWSSVTVNVNIPNINDYDFAIGFHGACTFNIHDDNDVWNRSDNTTKLGYYISELYVPEYNAAYEFDEMNEKQSFTISFSGDGYHMVWFYLNNDFDNTSFNWANVVSGETYVNIDFVYIQEQSNSIDTFFPNNQYTTVSIARNPQTSEDAVMRFLYEH